MFCSILASFLQRAVNDWKETVCQVSDYAYDEKWDSSSLANLHGLWLTRNLSPSVAANRPQKSYEFPNGYNNPFGKERFEVPEALFNPKRFLPNVCCS